VTAPTTVTTARGKGADVRRNARQGVQAREGVHRSARIALFGVIMGLLAVASLLLAYASLLVIGGVILALFLFFPLFLLGLVGVLAGLENRTVQQHNPAADGTKWRIGP
jgi:Flp pilus assembly protein TadB